MSRTIKPVHAGVIAGTLTLLASLTACGESATGPAAAGSADVPEWATGSSMALVVGAHANAPAPTLTVPFQEAVGAVVDSDRSVTLVLNDGSPAVTGEPLLLGNPDCKGTGCDTVRHRGVTQVQSKVAKMRATAPENNLLEAIGVAARSTSPGDTVAVCDSGLQSTGALNFTRPGMLTATPAEVVDFLSSTGSLPDLSGRTVVFSCLGDTADPQEPLPTSARGALIKLWAELATAAGASSVYIDDTPVGGRPVKALPEVTPVPVPEVKSFKPTTAAPPVEVLREDRLAFLPDSTRFIDPAAADATLKPYATWLTQKASRRLHLTGTTSSAGTASGRKQLSQARADAVKAALVAMGAPGGHISTDGVGMDWDGYVDDRDDNGTLLPAEASSNRSVIVEFRSK